jgi:putative serine protease PepD
VRGPKHLWTGDWRAHRDDQPPTVPPLRELPKPPQEPPPPKSRRGVYLLGAGLIALMLLVTAFILGGALDRDAPAPRQRAQAPVARTPIGAIYARASPAVVSVRTRGATGTGWLFDRDGTLVTNAHVVGRSSRVAVRFGPNGRSIEAQVLGTDASSDLAVLKISVTDTPNVDPLVLADSSRVKIGDTAVAIGNPFGLDRTATAGIVSGLRRHIPAPNGARIDQVIQTDAPINPGNSGGPLLDVRARVIGVNSQIATRGQTGNGNVGIGFAVPSNTVRQVVPRLRAGGTITRPFLGVKTIESTSIPGAIVADVVSGGPAEQGGLTVGDVIQSVGGAPVRASQDVSLALDSRRPGEEIEIEVQRAGSERTLRVTLGTRPENAQGAPTGP